MIAAIILYMASIQINLFIQQPFINFMLTLFWIVLITNSFNLLDNMDGLSAGVAMICLISGRGCTSGESAGIYLFN